MTTTPGRMSGPGTIVFSTSDEVRAAVSSTRVPSVEELLEALPLDSGVGTGQMVDVDIDADLPLPADCLAEWTQVHALADRMRSLHMVCHARVVLARVLRSEDGADRIDDVLRLGTSETADDQGEQGGSGAFGPAALAVVVDDDRTMEMLERLPEPEDQLTYNVTLKTRLSAARRETGRALAAFLGAPRILASAVEGDVPFNKLDRLMHRVVSAQLTVSQMNEVDEFASELKANISLDQFDKRIRQYILTYLSRPAPSPESIYERRGVDFQKFPDGSGEYRAYGPAVELEAFYQRHHGTSRAISRSELAALDVTPDVADALRFGSDGQVLSDVAGADLESVDERRINQLMFDTLVSSVPQTRVRVIRKSSADARGTDANGTEARDTNASDADASGADPGEVGASGSASCGEDGSEATRETSGSDDGGASDEDSFLVTVACPTTGSWLRKQAAVTITMSLATLAGLGDDPATLGLSTPLPAAQARQVASTSTVWRRILYDPADGTITDEATRTYTPTASMRRAVEQKWRTCMAPGCSRNAARCEIDHCEPFCHDDPGRGGPTHPNNLIPLCVLHHQLKTNGVIRLRRVGPDDVEWVLPLGVITRTSAPSAATDGRKHSVSEEVMGLHLRSPAFEGPAVGEVLYGRQKCTDLFDVNRTGCRTRAAEPGIAVGWTIRRRPPGLGQAMGQGIREGRGSPEGLGIREGRGIREGQGSRERTGIDEGAGPRAQREQKPDDESPPF
ncbi:HNH endonuclease signature motif containing protein [Brevibacterium yomogidense]|uniref:HNH endonuclease signature motif containing protein n=1 Tax=Brevibacterium yomogidense TaxID=946573 RepID=UPI0018DF9BC9|nr:HNH endonuclease signature motif containing protein [Brevibacterium yomogidense]